MKSRNGEELKIQNILIGNVQVTSCRDLGPLAEYSLMSFKQLRIWMQHKYYFTLSSQQKAKVKNIDLIGSMFFK